MKKTADERFWALVTPTGFCWEWQGTLRDGYGKINVDGGRGDGSRACRSCVRAASAKYAERKRKGLVFA